MSTFRQRSLVLWMALALTSLLLGGLAGAGAVWQNFRERLQNPEFLNQQLKQLAAQDGGKPTAAPRALIRVAAAGRKQIEPQRSLIGRLVEVRKVTVASEVAGKIVELPVEVGTPTVGGETVLARVDDVWNRLAAKRSQALLESAQAQLVYQQAELRRGEQLSLTNVVTASELESRQAMVSELQAKVAEAKAALEEEHERIERSVIRAPFDGSVVAKLAELGGYLSPGDPIVEIVSSGQLDALLMVPESMINLISLEQTLPIRIDPLGDDVPGTVVSVTPYGPTASRTFPVRVRLDDQGGRLKAGMSITASIATETGREALVVTRDAVLVRPDGATVWVAVPEDAEGNAQVHPVPVALTARMTTEYAVEAETEAGRELLGEGAAVVIEGAERLTPDQQVRIVRLQEE